MSTDPRQSETLLLTVPELAELLRVSTHTIYSWRKTGKPAPPSVKVGGQIRYRRADVEAWLAALDTAA